MNKISTDEGIKKTHTLQAGVFSILYQNGFLRHIQYGDLEILRMIYMALRDQNWMTYEPIIENEKVHQEDDSFAIQYDCFHELNGKRIFHWRVDIKGSSDSKISFEIHGEALTNVIRNRAGICVLHPIKSTAGQPCETLHPDGTQIKKVFPVLISCDNPFKNLQGFRWRCRHDWFVLRFEGDLFETEDQRNWSDASYKTFCTPLEIPFPVELKAGDKVHQKVIFQADSEILPIPKNTDDSIEIVALAKKSKLPAIGIAASTETDVLSEDNLQALSALNLNHYRIEVQPSLSSWVHRFTLDCKNAEKLKLPLEIALHVKSPAEIRDFCQAYKQLKPAIQRIILLSVDRAATEQSIIDEAESLKNLLSLVKIGAGTDYNFRELNCNPFHAELLDFISYSIDPQEHATDDLTIMENIQAQGDAVDSAKNMYRSKAIHISSLTLRKRFNPAAKTANDKILTNERKADPRQQTKFGAAFTLGSIKALSVSDARSVTLYQSVGSQGILSEAGNKYPVYEVLKEILTSNVPHVVHTESSQPHLCDALLLNDNQSFKLILANYSSTLQRVIFRKDAYTLNPLEIRVVNLN